MRQRRGSESQKCRGRRERAHGTSSTRLQSRVHDDQLRENDFSAQRVRDCYRTVPVPGRGHEGSARAHHADVAPGRRAQPLRTLEISRKALLTEDEIFAVISSARRPIECRSFTLAAGARPGARSGHGPGGSSAIGLFPSVGWGPRPVNSAEPQIEWLEPFPPRPRCSVRLAGSESVTRTRRPGRPAGNGLAAAPDSLAVSLG